MKRLPSIFLLLLATLVLTTTAAPAQYKSFTVNVVGKGRPMLLIPGLSCPGAVWDETVAHYQDRYQCHVVSLAGFGGTAPAPPAVRDSLFLQTVRDELIGYIRANRLQKPVVVGHSLGGSMALWIGSTQPDLVGPLVIVDGLPFLPAVMMPGATVESARQMAGNMRRMMANTTDEQTRTYQQMTLRTMMNDEARIRQATEWMVASDRKTVGQAMYELYTTDLRPDVANIKAPTLVMGAWIGYKDWGATRETSLRAYQTQFARLPNHRIEMFDTAKHFIMWDDPAGFFKTLDGFLAQQRTN